MGVVNSSSDLALQSKIVTGISPVLLTSNAGDYVNLQFYEKVAVILTVTNAAAAVTGGAVTLKQATDVAGSGEKALSFTSMYANEDAASKDALIVTAVVSDTFTMPTTANAKLLYIIEISASDLDTANDFACMRIDIASAINQTGGAIYLLWPPNTAGVIPSALVD